MAGQRAELKDAAAPHPRHAVQELFCFVILYFGALIECGAVHRSVATPAKIRKRSCNHGKTWTGNVAGSLKPCDAGLFVQVCPWEERRKVNHVRQVVEAEFVDDRWPKIARQGSDDVLAASIQRSGAQRREGVRVVQV